MCDNRDLGGLAAGMYVQLQVLLADHFAGRELLQVATVDNESYKQGEGLIAGNLGVQRVRIDTFADRCYWGVVVVHGNSCCPAGLYVLLSALNHVDHAMIKSFECVADLEGTSMRCLSQFFSAIGACRSWEVHGL